MEYDTPDFREQLRAALDKVGKHNVPIIKTDLWMFAVDQVRQEQNRRLRKFDDDIDYLNADPPNELALKPSRYPRVLVVGTKLELGFRTRTVSKGDGIIALGSANVTEDIDLSAVIDTEIVALCHKYCRGDTVTVTFCSQAGLFWSGFFLSQQFLDDVVSLPQLIVTSGNIRSQYELTEDGDFGNSQHEIFERLAVIAQRWSIPIERIVLAQAG